MDRSIKYDPKSLRTNVTSSSTRTFRTTTNDLSRSSHLGLLEEREIDEGDVLIKFKEGTRKEVDEIVDITVELQR